MRETWFPLRSPCGAAAVLAASNTFRHPRGALGQSGDMTVIPKSVSNLRGKKFPWELRIVYPHWPHSQQSGSRGLTPGGGSKGARSPLGLPLSDTSRSHVLCDTRGNFARNVVLAKFRCAAHRRPGGGSKGARSPLVLMTNHPSKVLLFFGSAIAPPSRVWRMPRGSPTTLGCTFHWLRLSLAVAPWATSCL